MEIDRTQIKENVVEPGTIIDWRPLESVIKDPQARVARWKPELTQGKQFVLVLGSGRSGLAFAYGDLSYYATAEFERTFGISAGGRPIVHTVPLKVLTPFNDPQKDTVQELSEMENHYVTPNGQIKGRPGSADGRLFGQGTCYLLAINNGSMVKEGEAVLARYDPQERTMFWRLFGENSFRFTYPITREETTEESLERKREELKIEDIRKRQREDEGLAIAALFIPWLWFSQRAIHGWADILGEGTFTRDKVEQVAATAKLKGPLNFNSRVYERLCDTVGGIPIDRDLAGLGGL